MKNTENGKLDNKVGSPDLRIARSNVIKVDAFFEKKRDAENRRALEKVLSRAEKLNW